MAEQTDTMEELQGFVDRGNRAQGAADAVIESVEAPVAEVPAAAGATQELKIEDKVVVFGNRIVGEFDGTTLTLNAGWCRLAGLGLRIQGDTTDNRRIVFDRPPTDHRLASRA